ncbi:MAG: BatA domain-containing protein [Gemmatimonadales bacterium]
MGLGWLVPALLAGLAALVVPILVHLRQRERRDPVGFPSLMFLRRVPSRTAERRRITHPLLLLLRALAIAALVAAFARPFWRQADPSPAAGDVQRTLIVAVDRSLSMGYRGVWERVRDSIDAALGTLGAGDQAALVAFDDVAEVLARPSADLSGLRALLAGLEPGSGDSRIAPAVRVVRDLAAEARGTAIDVVIVSDLQRHAMAGLESVERIPGASMRFVSVAEPDPANARVVQVEVDRRTEGRRTRLAVSAPIASKGVAGRETRAALLVNGRELASTRVTLSASGTTTASFEPVWIAEGDGVAAVALEPDALAADDTLRFSLTAAAGVPVLLLVPPGTPAEDAVFLERALAINRAPALAVTVRRGAAPSERDLEQSRVVVVADAGGVTTAGMTGLRSFVEGGGGLLMIAGRSAPGAGSPWLPAAIGGTVDRTTDRGGRLGQLDGDHPVFEPFKEALARDFGAARFFRYRDLTADSSAQVVARFDDGRPALVDGVFGTGRVVVSALAVGTLWSDFALQPVFLPLMQQLVGHVGQLREEKRWYAAGEAAALPQGTEALTLVDPSGESRRLAADSIRTVTLDAVGIYQLRSDVATAPLAQLAVNPAPAESDLTAITPADALTQLRAPADSATAPTVAPLTATEQEQRQSGWSILLILALSALGAETLYTARATRRARDTGGTA